MCDEGYLGADCRILPVYTSTHDIDWILPERDWIHFFYSPIKKEKEASKHVRISGQETQVIINRHTIGS